MNYRVGYYNIVELVERWFTEIYNVKRVFRHIFYLFECDENGSM